MMRLWHLIILIILQQFLIILSSAHVNGSILNSVFGYPTECNYQNLVRPCRLSISCWLQGGIHVNGCGTSKWLISCCITEADLKSKFILELRRPAKIILKSKNVDGKIKRKSFQTIQKKNVLRRRADENMIQLDCGIPRTAQNVIQKRIIGGRPAHFAEYPWQAHIRISEFQCGGVLVSSNFIATAAHCIQLARTKDIIVYLGELDTQNSGHILEPLPAEKHRVIKKIIHPKFQFRITQPDRFDLALLQLSTPAGFKNHIQPICLPTSNIDLIGRNGIIAGWGKTNVNMGHSGTNILQSASVPIIDTHECIDWHESKQINVELYDEMFCAGHPDGHQDACLGDSGGPLIVMDKGRFTLIGITSAGFGCGIDHQPGIYHNVQMSAKWIQDVIYNRP